MRTLRSVINYKQAPLVQWEPVVGEKPSDGKVQEDKITHGAILAALKRGRGGRKQPRSIVNLISDEGRLELRIAEEMPKADSITLVTLQGPFAKAARHNVAASHHRDRVKVTTDIDAVRPGSQDAVIMNMILGCVSTPENHRNLEKLVKLVSSWLKEDGEAIIVRPNPKAGACSTYTTLERPGGLCGGQEYEFLVTGLESLAPMKNIYTTGAFLHPYFAAAGLKIGGTQFIADQPAIPAPGAKTDAFLLNIAKKHNF
jgi:hypothetical protein